MLGSLLRERGSAGVGLSVRLLGGRAPSPSRRDRINHGGPIIDRASRHSGAYSRPNYTPSTHSRLIKDRLLFVLLIKAELYRSRGPSNWYHCVYDHWITTAAIGCRVRQLNLTAHCLPELQLTCLIPVYCLFIYGGPSARRAAPSHRDNSSGSVNYVLFYWLREFQYLPDDSRYFVTGKIRRIVPISLAPDFFIRTPTD